MVANRCQQYYGRALFKRCRPSGAPPHTEAANSGNNTKVKITTTIDAAIKTQCFATGAAIAMRGKLTTAEHILINTGGDKDHVDLYRGLRMRNKMIRCSISQRVTGSRRRYAEALVIALPYAIVIQRNVRRLFAVKLSVKLEDSSCRDSSKTDCLPSHTSGISAAIAMHIQDTVTTPNISRVWGGKSSTKFYVKLDGKSVGKVEIDRGAWGEYSDNPDDVKDWENIMLEVRKFAGPAFVLQVKIKLNHQLEKNPRTRGEGRIMVTVP